ncbi:pilus assembly protein TadG-related protein [Noviherbaspirillum saxi]|uniref:Pilus assembly protein n=1 Tax=Noviherbaspirillum saxi TaxID=2320863 RepID=A0A3A3FZX6_9BURK|nr:pilus assembly protein TadG-related protein [Noviherbaspirillum saxi]RJF92629.1 pilus assembly protein [Noviherbaspirillum saxi]
MSIHSPSGATRRLRLARQGGAVAILVGLSMVVLVGFAGLALDTGRLYIAKTELQNSADACALAAAQALTGVNADQLEKGELAGIATGTRNAVLMQGEAVEVNPDETITFSTTLNGAYQTKAAIGAGGALAMKFARCEVVREAIPNFFMRIASLLPGPGGAANQTVRASAIAGLRPSQTNCAIPVALCHTAAPATTPRGTWLEGAIGPGGGGAGNVNMTGNFKWVDFTPPGGGASELRDVLNGPGVCNLPAVGAQVGQPGNVSSTAQAWNARFGIYQGSVREADAVPDFTGYGYTEVNWPSQFGAFNNFQTQRNTNTAYQGDAATGLSTNGTVSNSTYLGTNGADRRLGIVPIVDCAGFTSGSTAPVTDWACILMLHPINNSSGGGGGGSPTGRTRMFLEYLGRANEAAPPSPCTTLGLPGAPGSAGPLVPTLVR